MIEGLYEAHLRVTDLERSIAFYESLGLQRAREYESVAFVWVEPGRSWIGLWQEDNPYVHHMSHVALSVPYEKMRGAIAWLKERDVEPVEHRGMVPSEPIARPAQGNCSVYFHDPDGNLLELICDLPGEPEDLPRMHLSEWESSHR